jgi:hypothetical protein
VNMHINPDELLSAVDTAVELHQQPNTLACWRNQGKGPAYVKVGRQVFYRRADIAEWLAKQRREPKPYALRHSA